MRHIKHLFFAGTLLFLGLMAMGQNGPVVVEVKDGNLPQNLPYGVAFTLKGDAIHPVKGDQVFAIDLIIRVENNKDSTVYSWKRDGEEKEFSLFIDEQLYPGLDYSFKFNYYIEQTVSTEVADKFIKQVKDKALQEFREREGTSYYQFDSIIGSVVNLLGDDYPEYFYFDEGEKVQGLKLLYDKDWYGEVLDLAQAEVDVERKSKDLIAYKVELKRECEDRLNDTENKPSQVISDELKKIIKAIEANRSLPDSKPVLKSDKSLAVYYQLEKIESLQRDIVLANKRVVKHTSEIPVLERKLRSSRQLVVSSVLIDPKSKNSKTQKSTIEQIGLRYGVGYSPIGGDDNMLFQYAVTRFYIAPIDKKMTNPYYKWYNHIALNIGAVLGDLDYKGEKLYDNRNLKLKLVTSVSYDIFPQVSANVGAIWYDQSVGDQKDEIFKTKASVFMGLSFDINIIENIKK
jgi:hypothetical protein